MNLIRGISSVLFSPLSSSSLYPPRSFADDLDDDDDEESDDPEDVQQAWGDMVEIQREQDRYEGIKQDLQQDLADVKRTAKKLEDVSIVTAFL